MSESYKEIVVGLSELIAQAMVEQKTEETYPCSNADRSEERIRFYGSRVERLRKVRDEFEQVMTEVAP